MLRVFCLGRRYSSPLPHSKMRSAPAPLTHATYSPTFPSSRSPRADLSDSHCFDRAAPYKEQFLPLSGPHDTPLAEELLADRASRNEAVQLAEREIRNEESPYITIPVAEYRRLLGEPPGPGTLRRPEETPPGDSVDCSNERPDTKLRSDAAADAHLSSAQSIRETVASPISPRVCTPPGRIRRDAGRETDVPNPDNQGYSRHRSDVAHSSGCEGMAASEDAWSKAVASSRQESDTPIQRKRELADFGGDVKLDLAMLPPLHEEPSSCGKRNPHVDDSNTKERVGTSAQSCDSLVKGESLAKNADLDAESSRAHPVPGASETDSAKNTYSEIDRRLTALQDFLKSTRQTFRMLERSDALQAD